MEQETNQDVAGEGKPTDALKAARDYGIDVEMLRDNLKRTVAERLRRHQIALDTAEQLQKGRRL